MKLINVIPTNNYELILQYSNNEVRVYDVKPLLEKGVFQLLKNKNIFYTVRIEESFDTVEWPNVINEPGHCSEIDIAPETLYQDSILIKGLI